MGGRVRKGIPAKIDEGEISLTLVCSSSLTISSRMKRCTALGSSAWKHWTISARTPWTCWGAQALHWCLRTRHRSCSRSAWVIPPPGARPGHTDRHHSTVWTESCLNFCPGLLASRVRSSSRLDPVSTERAFTAAGSEYMAMKSLTVPEMNSSGISLEMTSKQATRRLMAFWAAFPVCSDGRWAICLTRETQAGSTGDTHLHRRTLAAWDLPPKDLTRAHRE